MELAEIPPRENGMRYDSTQTMIFTALNIPGAREINVFLIGFLFEWLFPVSQLHTVS